MNVSQITDMLPRVESYVAKGLYTEATTDLNELLGIVQAPPSPLDAPTFVRLVRALRELAEYDELALGKEKAYASAGEVMAQATKLYPSDPALINEQGLLFFSQSKFAEALSEFQRVIEEPAFTEADKALAFQWSSACYRRTFLAAQAEALIKTAVTQVGDKVTGLATERAWLLYDVQNYDQALSGFESVLASNPNDESALAGQLCCLQHADDKSKLAQRMNNLPSFPKKRILRILGICAAIHNAEFSQTPADSRLPAGLTACNQMIDLDPGNTYLVGKKVEGLRDSRKYREAEDLCSESLKTSPGDEWLMMNLGWVYYYQQRYQEAYTIFASRELNENAKAREWVITTLRKMNQFDIAREKLQQALTHFGDSAGLLGEKATLYFAERRYEEAIKMFGRALDINKDDEFALQWRIAAHRKLRQFDPATAFMQIALAHLPQSAELYGEQGWLLFDQLKLEEAHAAFRKASELWSYDTRFAFGRVEVLLKLGRALEARRILEDLRERFRDDEEIEERFGWFCLSQNSPVEAQRLFQAMVARDPTSVAGINGMGGFYLDQRDYRSAERQFRLAIERVSYQPQYHINLAWALLRQANEGTSMQQVDPTIGVRKFAPATENLLTGAESSCKAALKLDPFSAKAMECLGVIAFKRGRLVEAEDYFRSSIRVDPQQGSHVDLAALYTQIGRHEDADSELTTALKLNRYDGRALVELANLRLAKGELGTAAAACRLAIFADPGNDECHRALAIALIRAGQFTEAERVIREAIGRLDEVRRWRLHLLLSQVLVRLGDDNNKDRMLYEEAMQHVNAARRTRGANEEVHFHAGIVHFRLEDYPGARRSFEDCLRSNSQRFDAERNAKIIMQRVREIRKVNRINIVGGLSLAGFCLAALIAVWLLFLTGWGGKVDSTLITFLTPLLFGLIIVSLLLPNLNKLKLPGGFEADISEQKPREISSGPKGEIGFGSSQEGISPGPR